MTGMVGGIIRIPVIPLLAVPGDRGGELISEVTGDLSTLMRQNLVGQREERPRRRSGRRSTLELMFAERHDGYHLPARHRRGNDHAKAGSVVTPQPVGASSGEHR
jgi:hypothetical protein